jgi:hypothetical protein
MLDVSEERIGRLENAVRRWQVVALVALVFAFAAAALALVNRGVQREVQARSFTLVNESGDVLGRLADSSGGPFLLLHGRSGSDLLLGSIFDDVGLGILADEKVRMNLVVGSDGAPTLGMSDRQGANRLLLGLGDDDLPYVLMLGAPDAARLAISLGRKQMLQIIDAQGVPIFVAPGAAGGDGK